MEQSLPRLALGSGRRVLLFLGVLMLVAPLCSAYAAEDVRFNRDVRPLLADRCFECHGPDPESRQRGLRLDTVEGPEGAYRMRDEKHAIKPGSLDESELWYRLTTEDELDRMPPVNSHKKPLNAEELRTLRHWIEQGAQYEAHWSFVAPTRPALPEVEDEDWIQQPLDRFVLRKLEASNLRPNPQADKRTLIRRVTLDLTGLPPTRVEIRDFLGDDGDDAYERLVDRLLARPQYGEHMAKYWLDLVRFADTNGKHHDHYREMTPYRDWVIRAFNANLPYDRFVTSQIAGDLYADPTVDQLTASGFNRLHLIIDLGTMLPEESLARNVLDRTTAVGTTFMGLTFQCAVCHDHKFDPISQRDFFQLFAFFNNIDAEAETTKRRQTPDFVRGLQPPYISFPTADQTASLAAIDREQESTEAQIAILKKDLAEADLDVALEKELEAKLKRNQDELERLREEGNEIRATVAATMVMREREEMRPAYILIGGNYENPGELVARDTPAFLPPMKSKEGVKSRMDLAEWLVAPEHPLTARVAVNRFWQQLFGVGLVKTSEDLGTQGEWPSHIDLVDDLAVAFVESGWDVKALFKQMVLSATYQQSSKASPAIFEADPENRRLARGSRFRMDSEMIRDQILASSGLLSPTMYGPSVKPPQPPGIWEAVTLPHSYPRVFEADHGDKIYRRSVYTFWKRGMPPPQMSILNAPTRETCTARRERTNTPLQALLLLNEEEYLKAGRHLAFETLQSRALSPSAKLGVIYERITSRSPSAEVSRSLLRSVGDLQAMYAKNPELAEQLCDGLLADQGPSCPELAAWTVLVSAVYNLDIAKTRE